MSLDTRGTLLNMEIGFCAILYIHFHKVPTSSTCTLGILPQLILCYGIREVVFLAKKKKETVTINSILSYSRLPVATNTTAM